MQPVTVTVTGDGSGQRSRQSHHHRRDREVDATGAAVSQPESVSGYGKVTASGDDHYGHVGQIDPYKDDEHIFLKFDGDNDLYAYEHSEVEPVTTKPPRRPSGKAEKKTSAAHTEVPPTTPLGSRAARTARPVAPPSKPSLGSPLPAVQRFWVGLPMAGRIAVLAVSLIVIAGSVAAIAFSYSSGSGPGSGVGQTRTADSGFSGYKGDRDAGALQADTGLSDPAGYARTVCNLRAQGFSEQRTIELNATGLRGERERAVTDQDALLVVASEYHFCPEYYNR